MRPHRNLSLAARCGWWSLTISRRATKTRRRVGLNPSPREPSLLRSAVREHRRPLLDERRHAFLLVFGREQRIELPALEPRAFGERGGKAAIDRLLDHHHRVLRQASDLGRDL